MTQKRKSSGKKPASKAKSLPAKSTSRRLKSPLYKSFKLTKKIKPSNKKLEGSFKLFNRTAVTIKQHWKIFVGISVVYMLVSLILVRGLSSQLDIQNLKDSLKDASSGKFGSLSGGAVIFTYLIGTTNFSSSEAGGVYQMLLLLIVSLAVIWTLRKVLAGEVVRVRDSFYKSMQPFIPFVLVLLVIGLQLIPLLIGSWLFGTITINGIAVTALEKGLWALLCLLLATLSLYMICSSLFALYIVTLPDMTPMKALRSARQLVRHRRWEVLRKILFLPFALLVLAAVIFIPLVIVVAPAVEWVFFALSAFVPIAIHGYMYTLYRELL